LCRISSDGRRFRILTVLDDCTRQCLALVADTSLSGIRVARELDRLVIERGKPKMVVSDNAPAEEDAGYRRRPPDLTHRYFISLKSPTAS
jgi:transposase InsO family protein